MPLALQLARELDAEMYLARVVVWIDAFSGLRFDPDILRMIDDAKSYLSRVASRFELPADRTVSVVRHGDNAAKEIVTVAKEEGVDLIIMAGRCKDWLRRLARGSVYWEVVHSRVCPVCVCPYPARELGTEAVQRRPRGRPMRILVAVDGSAECEMAAGVAARWVGALNAEVYLLQIIDGFASTRRHVHHEPGREAGLEDEIPVMMNEARTYLNELASRFQLQVDRTVPLVRHGADPATEIINVAEEEHIDLIVMASHCRGWIGRLTRGSVSSDVVRSRVCPVVCVPLRPAQSPPRTLGVMAGAR